MMGGLEAVGDPCVAGGGRRCLLLTSVGCVAVCRWARCACSGADWLEEASSGISWTGAFEVKGSLAAASLSGFGQQPYEPPRIRSSLLAAVMRTLTLLMGRTDPRAKYWALFLVNAKNAAGDS
mmetsp:Transcript_59471/g.158264  ORF Transcript_59471/g.158264 Transcript_59471/m.158264 type:complete len:123 (+) Transcript_59471:96-464(+)